MDKLEEYIKNANKEQIEYIAELIMERQGILKRRRILQLKLMKQK